MRALSRLSLSVLLALLLLFGPTLKAAGTLLASVKVAGTTAAATTAAIDATGATAFLGCVIERTPQSVVLTDSEGSTWNSLTSQSDDGNDHVTTIYWSNPSSVSATHTFTATSSDWVGHLYMTAWSGVIVNPFDQQNGVVQTASSTVQPGSITPTNPNQIVLTCSTNDNTTNSIDGGFTLLLTDPLGTSYGGALSYLIQTTAAAANPTTTFSGLTTSTAVIGSFKTESSGPAGIKTYNGVASASVKTIIGIAIASIKSWLGIT